MSEPARNTALQRRWRVPLSLVALVAAAVASQLLLWWLTPAPVHHTMAGPPRSDYTLRDFSLNVLKEDGSVAMRMQAPHLQRRNGDGSLYITAPRFELPGSGNDSQWLGKSERGWVSADGSELKLLGAVHMHRPATATVGEATIDSADIIAWPDRHQLATPAPTVIREPGRILRGTGMQVDLATHTMELMANVHGTFQPARH
ncbi:MAG TPA: LPS export ABC transporter periplasmic protein LptC [Rhodanobacteraceae bacterium]|nr:LPS export ABC transporter periplasmic protein LptC [Rhodanobacteraceae bacterium]